MSLSPSSIEYANNALMKRIPLPMIVQTLKSFRESEADINAFDFDTLFRPTNDHLNWPTY